MSNPLSSLNKERKRIHSKLASEAMRPLGDLKDSLSPDAPKLPAPVRMPDPDDDRTRIARSRARQRKYGGRGRQGTALSAGSTLG